MISIYLDDTRTPLEHPLEKEWVTVRDYDEFVDLVLKTGLNNVESISLDHDLGPLAIKHFFEHTRVNYTINYDFIREYSVKEKTGMDAVKWLVDHARENNLDLPQCYVHSANPIGCGNMMGYVNMYLKERRKPQTCIRAKWKHSSK
jgi:hypothetical protein